MIVNVIRLTMLMLVCCTCRANQGDVEEAKKLKKLLLVYGHVDSSSKSYAILVKFPKEVGRDRSAGVSVTIINSENKLIFAGYQVCEVYKGIGAVSIDVDKSLVNYTEIVFEYRPGNRAGEEIWNTATMKFKLKGKGDGQLSYTLKIDKDGTGVNVIE